MLRVGVTSTARASTDPQVSAGSCFVIDKKGHRQIRRVVCNVCHKGETRRHVLVEGNRTTLVYDRNVDKRKSSRRKDEDAECDQMGVKATKW